jgi:hypothetical protein
MFGRKIAAAAAKPFFDDINRVTGGSKPEKTSRHGVKKSAHDAI